MPLENKPLAPLIISMEVDDENETESEYRIKFSPKVKYLKVVAGTFDRDTLSFPLADLPPLPYEDDSWIVVHIFRDPSSSELKTSLTRHQIAGVENIWHSVQVDVLKLERVEQLTAATFEAISNEPNSLNITPPPTTVIVKIARFEWEIPRIEHETRAYQLLQ